MMVILQKKFHRLFKSSLGRQKAPLQAFFQGLQRFFVPPSPGNFASVTERFLYAA